MRRLPVLLATLFGPLLGPTMARAQVDFTRDIRPILSNHCFACHGPDEATREARLSLLTFESATAARKRGAVAIAPGDPERSLVWQRISDTEDPMPPIEAHKPLTDGQKDLLRQWIVEGASYAPHWAYVPPRRVPVPAGAGDPIDRWLDHRLAREGLEPSPPADAATLLRRVTTDLVGLPPTIDDLDGFLTDPSDAALAARVDALLASRHYGERMALMWLDLVRYADTVGYHGDQEHNVWPYRDWVIAAFSANMPFDAFTRAQLAGDLLPAPDQDDLVASTYNRLIQTTHEGGAQLEEYRAIYMADRVRNVSAVWMGATVGCAQCHDHKYDPYTARDYHALGAFFADIDEEHHLVNQYAGLNTSPTKRLPEMPVYSGAARAEAATLEQNVEQARSALDAAIASLAESRQDWEADLRARAGRGEPADEPWLDDAADTGGRFEGEWRFEHNGTPAAKSGTGYRRQSSRGLVQHYSANTQRTLAVAEGGVLYTWVYLDPKDPPRAVMLQFHTGASDWEHRAVWGDDSIPYGRRQPDWRGYQRMGPLPETGTWVCLEVETAAIGLRPEDHINGWAFTQHGGTVLWDRAGLRRGAIGASLLVALRADPRTNAQQALLDETHRNGSPAVMVARAALAHAEEARAQLVAALPRTLHTQRIDPPREVRVLPRGNFLDKSGAVVQPAVPVFLGAVAPQRRATRLDLARWLTDPNADGGIGELTARVFVNRLWTMLMGGGLCPSLEDFGGQGQPPVHGELLDMLALDLIESGWDIKGMLRRIVLTNAYRRSSVPSAMAMRHDPGNHFFARQSRARLPAELVRDRMLAASGLLVEDVGGPSVKPPQPEGLYRHLNFPKRAYTAHTDERQWRRGLYVHRQRQFLHPMLHAFDAPTQVTCTAERPVSNTPLAALNLLNDPIALAAARALAERALALPDHGTRDRLAHMMRLVTARHPSTAEIDRLETFYLTSLERWQGRPQAVREFTGSSDDPTVAAWTQVSRAVLNLHEAYCRE